MCRLHVRPATLADAFEVAAVHVASSLQVYAGIFPAHLVDATTVDERKRRWIEIWTEAGPDETTLIVEQAERLLGFGHCGPQRTDSLPYPAEFYSIYVQPEEQRRGAGLLLMRGMARFLQSRGWKTASLWVVRDNTGARRFYEAIGGRPVAEKSEHCAGLTIAEIAYGWDDLARL
jgi:ribosomal protein S18 acetylase RimI-like enzyme